LGTSLILQPYQWSVSKLCSKTTSQILEFRDWSPQHNFITLEPGLMQSAPWLLLLVYKKQLFSLFRYQLVTPLVLVVGTKVYTYVWLWHLNTSWFLSMIGTQAVFILKFTEKEMLRVAGHYLENLCEMIKKQKCTWNETFTCTWNTLRLLNIHEI